MAALSKPTKMVLIREKTRWLFILPLLFFVVIVFSFYLYSFSIKHNLGMLVGVICIIYAIFVAQSSPDDCWVKKVEETVWVKK